MRKIKYVIFWLRLNWNISVIEHELRKYENNPQGMRRWYDHLMHLYYTHESALYRIKHRLKYYAPARMVVTHNNLKAA